MPNMDWYAALAKSPLTPPPYVFQTIWPLLYLLMGISVYLYVRQTPKIQRPLGISFFGLQLFLNFLWSPVFFGMQHIGGALLILSLLIFAVLGTIWIFAKTSKTAAWLLAPYFIWGLFAWHLNFAVWQLN